MRKKTWQVVRRLLSVALVFALTIVLANPVVAEAKTKTLKLPFGDIGIPEESYIESVAVTINKTGTYKIQEKKTSFYFAGFIKFVVPKTKKYTFTFSEPRAKGKSPCLPYVDFTRPTGIENQITNVPGYSKGYSATNQFPFAYRVPGKNNVAKRTVTMNLEKDQVLYIQIVNAFNGSKGKKFTCKMKIK